MIRNKLVSVCMITHDSSDFLREALLSTFDFADEIIIVDNMSVDNTLDILNDFSSSKLMVTSQKFEGKTYQDIVKQKRNLCLCKAQGKWLIFQDPDEIYKKEDLIRLKNIIKNNDCVHVRYKSIQFWKDFDHVITGPHWDDTQERCVKNLPGLQYDKFAFSISVGKEILAKKYGKDYLNKIYWAKDDEVCIYHYGMCVAEWKIRRKLRNYLLSDNPVVTEENVEDFIARHPYFSEDFNQPRHGPKGLWIAGSDSEKTKEKIILFEGNHPETMQETVLKSKGMV